MAKNDVAMSVAVANALLTGQHVSEAQLESAYQHYKTLADHLTFSGPRFSDARLESVRMGNIALGRLRTERARIESEREARRQDDGLEEIR